MVQKSKYQFSAEACHFVQWIAFTRKKKPQIFDPKWAFYFIEYYEKSTKKKIAVGLWFIGILLLNYIKINEFKKTKQLLLHKWNRSDLMNDTSQYVARAICLCMRVCECMCFLSTSQTLFFMNSHLSHK